MIDREMINNAYNDAMKESKDEYEKKCCFKDRRIYRKL